MSVDPLALAPSAAAVAGRDPFDSNQAIPTVLFGRRRAAFLQAFPALNIVAIQRFAGPSYPASGGFSRRALLPTVLWTALHGLERRLPAALFRLIGFRLLVVIERR